MSWKTLFISCAAVSGVGQFPYLSYTIIYVCLLLGFAYKTVWCHAKDTYQQNTNTTMKLSQVSRIVYRPLQSCILTALPEFFKCCRIQFAMQLLLHLHYAFIMSKSFITSELRWNTKSKLGIRFKNTYDTYIVCLICELDLRCNERREKQHIL